MTLYIIKNSQVLSNCLQHLAHLNPEKIWEVEIKEQKRKRSNPQNNYWHELVAILAKDIGYSSDDMKHILKAEFLGLDVIEYNGKTLEKPRETSKLKIEEMSDLITKTKELGVKMGINLPDAGRYGL